MTARWIYPSGTHTVKSNRMVDFYDAYVSSVAKKDLLLLLLLLESGIVSSSCPVASYKQLAVSNGRRTRTGLDLKSSGVLCCRSRRRGLEKKQVPATGPGASEDFLCPNFLPSRIFPFILLKFSEEVLGGHGHFFGTHSRKKRV